ncbi:unnamed protein product [Larinioides sclopetarius]|uniref:Sulfotransferase domain-containing protein n=1 Tax=Larinioides sclopetarius TaxID=280406 RepID=A0AAV1ZN75_9ARAC
MQYSSVENMRNLLSRDDFYKEYLQASTGSQREKSKGDACPEMIRKGLVGDWRNFFSDDQSRRMDEHFVAKTKNIKWALGWAEWQSPFDVRLKSERVRRISRDERKLANNDTTSLFVEEVTTETNHRKVSARSEIQCEFLPNGDIFGRDQATAGVFMLFYREFHHPSISWYISASS